MLKRPVLLASKQHLKSIKTYYIQFYVGDKRIAIVNSIKDWEDVGNQINIHTKGR